MQINDIDIIENEQKNYDSNESVVILDENYTKNKE